jgi:hypothetical protein
MAESYFFTAIPLISAFSFFSNADELRWPAYNKSMMKKIATMAAVAVLLAAALAAEQKYSNLSFLVVKAENGKPVRNASVVLHPVNKDGQQAKGGLQLKTDPEGKASYPGAPFGKLRVQVLARGFQTFGEDYEISEPEQKITIELKRPKGQYSIYEDKKPEEKPK